MHPHYHFCRRRRPSRLLWFFIGAGAASLWIKHQQAANHRSKSYWKHCMRPSVRETMTESGLATWRKQCEGHIDMGWENEKENITTIARNAQDTMTSFSEATLDSLLETCTALKQKLVHHRQQRESQELEDRIRSKRT